MEQKLNNLLNLIYGSHASFLLNCFEYVLLTMVVLQIISGNFAFWLGSVFVFFISYHSFHLLFKTFLDQQIIQTRHLIMS